MNNAIEVVEKRIKANEKSREVAVSAEEDKREKADGGCLGVQGRRRTWHTAKSVGESCAGSEPTMSEWGNPAVRTTVTCR